jgi:hypothetical protein
MKLNDYQMAARTGHVMYRPVTVLDTNLRGDGTLVRFDGESEAVWVDTDDVSRPDVFDSMGYYEDNPDRCTCHEGEDCCPTCQGELS